MIFQKVWAINGRENCALLGHYAASSGNFLPTFRDNLSVPAWSRKTAKRMPAVPIRCLYREKCGRWKVFSNVVPANRVDASSWEVGMGLLQHNTIQKVLSEGLLEWTLNIIFSWNMLCTTPITDFINSRDNSSRFGSLLRRYLRLWFISEKITEALVYFWENNWGFGLHLRK